MARLSGRLRPRHVGAPRLSLRRQNLHWSASTGASTIPWPVLEFLLVALMPALTVEFARFAFSLFAPPVPERRLRWRLARARGAAERYPLYQIIAGMGVLWAALHLWSIPLSLKYWYLFALVATLDRLVHRGGAAEPPGNNTLTSPFITPRMDLPPGPNIEASLASILHSARGNAARARRNCWEATARAGPTGTLKPCLSQSSLRPKGAASREKLTLIAPFEGPSS